MTGQARLNLSFDSATRAALFGAEDAENEDIERFKEYFFFNKTYDEVNVNLPLRILVGPKGTGKSAILKRSYLDDVDKKKLAILLQPGDLYVKGEKSPDDFIAQIEEWKSSLFAVIIHKITQNYMAGVSEIGRFKGLKSVTAIVPHLVQMFQEKLPQVSNASTKELISSFVKHPIINVYIDDIDRGWSASPKDIRNISALINAMRDIAGSDRRIQFRIGLRSDVYFLVRTSDESTDKFEQNIVWLNWNNHEILCIMAKRIETFFGGTRSQDQIYRMKQSEISENIFGQVIETKFSGLGHWSNRSIRHVLLSLTRRRPRDLVKLMHGAAEVAFKEGKNKITSEDVKASFSRYSQERLRDIINEYKSEMPEIERLLLEMRPTKRERTTRESFVFSTDALAGKIRRVMEHVPIRFTNGWSVTPRSIIQFLYKIDFITARKEKSGFIDRKYFDQNNFLGHEFADFGYDWEIHPAYRWALQPSDLKDVMESVSSGGFLLPD